MTTVSASKARASLFKLIEDTSNSHEPVLIKGRNNGAVLVSEEDWRSIEETLFLLSIPGMRESIISGMKTPLKKCSRKPGW